jgi:hypothetical protein
MQYLHFIVIADSLLLCLGVFYLGSIERHLRYLAGTGKQIAKM